MIIEQPVSGIPDTGCLNVLLITVRPDPDMNRDNTLMITGDIRKKILLFALPIFLGNLFQQLYNAADSIIVGNFISSSALAAVSSAGNLIFLVIGFFNGISVGAGVVIAHYIGARDAKSTEEAVHTTVALGIVSSIILTAVGTLLAPVMLRLMNTPPEVLPQSITYFRIYFAGSFGFVMYNTFVGILQASGDSRHPLIYLAIASAVNVVLDLLLIAGLHMGVGAAAFATAVSQLLSAFLAMTKLLRTDADYRLVLTKIRFRKHLLKKVLQYGLPTGLSNSVMALSNVVIQSYINAYGAKAVAGIGAVGADIKSGARGCGGDGHRGNICRGDTALGKDLPDDLTGGMEIVVRIDLRPAVFRPVCGVFPGRGRRDLSIGVKQRSFSGPAAEVHSQRIRHGAHLLPRSAALVQKLQNILYKIRIF